MPIMPNSQWQLLKTSRFLPLFITQFLGAFNDTLFKTALLTFITFTLAQHQAQRSEILVSLAQGIFILPFFLFSATAGQFADKHEKSRLIRLIKFFEIVLMAAVIPGFYYNNPIWLMTVLFFAGVQATFFGPIKYSILPEHLAESELIGGNALIESATFLAILIGSIFGSLIVVAPQGIFLLGLTVITIAVGGWISSWFIPTTELAAPTLKIHANFLKATWEILCYAKQNKVIYSTIIGISWFWLIGSEFLMLLPVFTSVTLHAESRVFTLFLTLFSIGIGIGSLLCNRLVNIATRTLYIPIAGIGMTLFMSDLYFATYYLKDINLANLIAIHDFVSSLLSIRIMLDLLLLAISSGLFIVPLYTVMQSLSDKQYRSRIIACNNIMNALFMVAGALITLLLLNIQVSIVGIFLIVAIVNIGIIYYLYRAMS